MALSGLFFQCPMNKQDAEGKQVPEPFMEEAKFFTESRLLQKDVKIILEGVSNQNLLGTVMHPVSTDSRIGMVVCVLAAG